MTLLETKVVLEDGVAIGGKELRKIYEVINHKKAYGYVKKCIAKNKPWDESIVKDLNAILTENIIVGGIYRKEEVRISGAGFTPPVGNEMYMQIKNLYEDLKIKKNELNPIELAAWTHAEFVRIHPFIDGNGRTSRLLMNYQLLIHGYLPISVAKENRLDYYNAQKQAGEWRYKAEPYVYASNIFGPGSDKFGPANVLWLTGTAAWMYIAVTQYMLGIRARYDGLEIDPCLSEEMLQAKVTREFRGAKYDITITQNKKVFIKRTGENVTITI